jgi:hypothetical protein
MEVAAGNELAGFHLCFEATSLPPNIALDFALVCRQRD